MGPGALGGAPAGGPPPPPGSASGTVISKSLEFRCVGIKPRSISTRCLKKNNYLCPFSLLIFSILSINAYFEYFEVLVLHD